MKKSKENKKDDSKIEEKKINDGPLEGASGGKDGNCGKGGGPCGCCKNKKKGKKKK